MQSVENSTKYKFLKFRSNFLEWVRNDLKTIMSLVMPNLYCLDVMLLFRVSLAALCIHFLM